MLSRLRPRKLSCASITRVVLAAMLLLVLLAGVVPYASLSSSAEQTCTMSCCAGKPAHMTGSCGAAFSTKDEPVASPEIVEAPSHCGKEAAPPSDSKEESSSGASHAGTFIKANVLTTACSPECAAAAATTFSQVRRTRDTSALAASNRPLAPSYASLAEHVANLQKASAAQGRQARPRAPPRSFF